MFTFIDVFQDGAALIILALVTANVRNCSLPKFQSPRIGCFSRSILPPRRETTRRDRDALKREADELAQ